jgi:predicted metal-dependent hydrolase
MTAMANVDGNPLHANPVSRKLRGEDVGVPVRKVAQDYSRIPRHWFRNNAFLSMFFNGFSATLPAGEGQFMHAVRLFQDKITEPVLRAQIRAFIGQEAHHSREHDALNNALKAQGIDLDAIETRMTERMEMMRGKFTAKQLLAWTVCGEHITALMADYMINKHPELLDEADPTVAKIWAWHAIEETEHKAVAFDVYDQLVGDRNLLRRMMAVTTVMFLTLNTREALRLMRDDEQRKDLKMWLEASRFLFTMMKEIGPEYLDFYKQDFHPWQHDNRDALQRARAKYLGESV